MLSFLKASSEDAPAKGRLWIILLVALLGVLLLLFGGSLGEETKDDEETPQLQKEDLTAYREALEERIRKLCESVKGVENVSVMVTLESGFSSIYATEWEGDKESYVILGSGSSAQALYLGQSSPTVTGIGIVCTGGGNATVRRELTALLCATFDLSSTRIHVAERGP
ncbi:MAG: hypothetical protein IIV17_02785 [Clostridia bacterium]|nr:hypothetical protein [Clostridia bacterium]